jgi:glycosyltransferase involved in cell wall biosynthesis
VQGTGQADAGARAGGPRARRRILIVAFHFPPVQGSTGVYRALSFAKHLPSHGWDVTVLTSTLNAYPETRAENLSIIPPDTRVVRAWTLDTQRHLAIAGRYPQALATPDRWQSWIASGVIAGLGVIRSWRPDAILSTYPIPSAHSIGLALHRMSSVPWIADFRDPMLQDDYPHHPMLRKAYASIERATFKHANRVTVTTPGTAELYAERYRERPANSVQVIANGFDEDMFANSMGAGASSNERAATQHGDRQPLQLLHSGLLYPHERNPELFFQAAAELLQEGVLREGEVLITLRASGNEAAYQKRIDELGLQRVIRLMPPVPYRDALVEMLASDACLIFQANSCNQQIPAKVYEYLYARKPILGLTDPVGDTGRLLASTGTTHIAALEDKAGMKRALRDFVGALREGNAPRATRDVVMQYSRRASSERLARLLDEVADSNPAAATAPAARRAP